MTGAAELEHKVEASQRRFFGALAAVQAVVMAVLLIALLVLVQRVGDVERRDAASNEAHRQRNELIHGCVNAKLDKLRLDIAALVQNPHGGFATDDGIRCPAIRP